MLLALGLAAGSGRAHAELVTHQFWGVVASVTTYPPGSPSPFAWNQPCAIAYTVERSTPGSPVTAFTDCHPNAIQQLEVTVDGETVGLAPGGTNTTCVTDNAPGPSIFLHDGYDFRVSAPTGPLLAGVHVGAVEMMFEGGDQVFSDKSIPLWFPLGAMYGQGQFAWSDPETGVSGYVTTTVTQFVVPARPTSWGRVKSLYAR